jgi:CRP-like cAMP-binding protein
MPRTRRTTHSAIAPLLDAGLDRLLAREALVELAAHTDVVHVGRGVTLAIEGTKAHQFSALVDGEVTVRRAGLDPIASGPGAWFGLGELLTDMCYGATVVTAVPSSIVVVFGPPLRRALAAREHVEVAASARTLTVGFAGGRRGR